MKKFFYITLLLLSILVAHTCDAQQNTNKTQATYDATAIIISWQPGSASATIETGTKWSTSDVTIDYFKSSHGKPVYLTETEVHLKTSLTNGTIEITVVNGGPTTELLIGITPKVKVGNNNDI